MTKIALTISILTIAFSTTAINAQNWQFVTGDMRGSTADGDGTLIAVGQRGVIMRSSDSGMSWTTPKSGSYHDLEDIAFATPTIAVIVGRGGTVLRSEDKGVSWDRIEMPITTSLTEISFPTSATGYIAGGETLFATDNSGLTWRRLPDLPQPSLSLHLITRSIGLFTDFEGGIWRTVDSGMSWISTYTDTAAQFLDVTSSEDGTVILACGPVGYVLRSADSGQTWTPTDIADAGIRPYSISSTDNGIVVMSGNSLDSRDVCIRRSEDFGENWENIPVDARFNLFNLESICIDDRGMGIAVSNTGTILRTTDAWKTYATINDPTHEFPGYGSPTFRRPAFATSRIGIIPNSLFPGGYIRTTDGGITWLTRQYAAGTYSVPIFFSESDGILLRDHPKLLYRTTDAGATWKPAIADADPSSGTVSDMQFPDHSHGVQIGYIPKQNALGGSQSGIVYLSDDSGKTWQGETFDWPPLFSDMAFASRNVGWIGGGVPAIDGDSANDGYYYHRIYRTIDGGDNWTIIYDKFSKDADSYILGFRDEGHGYITTGGGDWGYPGQAVILETTDLGDTWNVLASFDNAKGEYAPIDIEFFTDSLWYGVGGNASIMVTRDAGRTWEREVIDPLPMLYNDRVPTFHKITLLPDRQTAMIFGQGVILRRTFPEPFSSVDDEKTPGEIEGSLSVIPNPARDEIRLVWHGPQGYMNARLYDVMGRDIFGESIPVGASGDARIDVTGLPSGTYRIVLHDKLGRRVTSTNVAVLR